VVKRRLLRAMAVGFVVAVMAIPSQAWAGLDPPSKPPPGCGSSCGTSDPPALKQGTVHNCNIVSSSSYLGLACAGTSDVQGQTVKEILGKDPVPKCWDVPLNPGELEAMGVENVPGPDGWTYYWARCLSGITKKSPSMDGATISVELHKIPNGGTVRTLTPNQTKLVGGAGDNGQIPFPVAGISPSDHPRVRQQVAFFDGTGGTVVVDAGAMTLRARVTGITVNPLGPGTGDEVSCAGRGQQVDVGDTPESRPGACWYAYQHSSARQNDQAYSAKITAHWTVDYQVLGGPWIVYNHFTKSQITMIPVTEIQTLVVN